MTEEDPDFVKKQLLDWYYRNLQALGRKQERYSVLIFLVVLYSVLWRVDNVKPLAWLFEKAGVSITPQHAALLIAVAIFGLVAAFYGTMSALKAALGRLTDFFPSRPRGTDLNLYSIDEHPAFIDCFVQSDGWVRFERWLRRAGLWLPLYSAILMPLVLGWGVYLFIGRYAVLKFQTRSWDLLDTVGIPLAVAFFWASFCSWLARLKGEWAENKSQKDSAQKRTVPPKDALAGTVDKTLVIINAVATCAIAWATWTNMNYVAIQTRQLEERHRPVVTVRFAGIDDKTSSLYLIVRNIGVLPATKIHLLTEFYGSSGAEPKMLQPSIVSPLDYLDQDEEKHVRLPLPLRNGFNHTFLAVAWACSASPARSTPPESRFTFFLSPDSKRREWVEGSLSQEPKPSLGEVHYRFFEALRPTMMEKVRQWSSGKSR